MGKLYTNLTESERNFIFSSLQVWKNKKTIALELWRHPSTITRELQRNSRFFWKERWWATKYYTPESAQTLYKNRKSNSCKRIKVLKSYKTRMAVIYYLKLHYSPWLISWILAKKWIFICAETIYSFIYDKDYKHLKLREYLPRHRVRRRHKWMRKAKSTKIPNRIGIEQRPEIINQRLEFGHWESDSVEGLRWFWYALHVSIERVSRYTKIKIIKRKWALETANAMKKIRWNLPKWAIKSTTPDNWTEFTKWEQVSKDLWIDFYFTRPYTSSDKWEVEKTNELIRRFYPKWTNFKYVSDEDIQLVEDWINNKPMVVLDYKTPKEVFLENIEKLQTT